MIRQSPLPVTRPQFPDDDPRWKFPGYNHNKELAKLWKGPKTLADRLWDAATSPGPEDIPSGDEDDGGTGYEDGQVSMEDEAGVGT
jgi:hypothetical protein